jgi:hypothetical protein
MTLFGVLNPWGLETHAVPKVHNHLPTIQKIRDLAWSLVDILLQIHIDYPNLFCLHKHFKFTENFCINFVLVCCSYWLYASIFITVCFIALFINKYNDIFLPMSRQIFLIPNRRIFFVWNPSPHRAYVYLSFSPFSTFPFLLALNRWHGLSSIQICKSMLKVGNVALPSACRHRRTNTPVTTKTPSRAENLYSENVSHSISR